MLCTCSARSPRRLLAGGGVSSYLEGEWLDVEGAEGTRVQISRVPLFLSYGRHRRTGSDGRLHAAHSRRAERKPCRAGKGVGRSVTHPAASPHVHGYFYRRAAGAASIVSPCRRFLGGGGGHLGLTVRCPAERASVAHCSSSSSQQLMWLKTDFYALSSILLISSCRYVQR